jgi:DNA replication and repair protein RecF
LYISDIGLRNIRCHSELDVVFEDEGVNLLVGANGSGKTTVLEAVVLTLTGRTYRPGPVANLVRRNQPESGLIQATLSVREHTNFLEYELPSDGGIFPTKASSRRSDIRVAPTVITSGDIELIQGGPELRRTHLDRLICEESPTAAARVRSFEKTLAQRSRLLPVGPTQWAASGGEVWDERLAELGEWLAQRRVALLDRLQEHLAAVVSQCWGLDTEIQLHYRRSWSGELGKALRESLARDCERETTSVGPHRDEVEISVANRPARVQLSEGEQRLVSIGVGLASHHLRSEIHNLSPILILDDILLNLDSRRSQRLGQNLPPGQVLMASHGDPAPGMAISRLIEMPAPSPSQPRHRRECTSSDVSSISALPPN